MVQIPLSLSEWRFVEKQSGTNKDWGKFKTLTVTTSINEIVQEKKTGKGIRENQTKFHNRKSSLKKSCGFSDRFERLANIA